MIKPEPDRAAYIAAAKLFLVLADLTAADRRKVEEFARSLSHLSE